MINLTARTLELHNDDGRKTLVPNKSRGIMSCFGLAPFHSVQLRKFHEVTALTQKEIKQVFVVVVPLSDSKLPCPLEIITSASLKILTKESDTI